MPIDPDVQAELDKIKSDLTAEIAIRANSDTSLSADVVALKARVALLEGVEPPPPPGPT